MKTSLLPETDIMTFDEHVMTIFTRQNETKEIVLRVTGEAMEPTLKAGDQVLCKTLPMANIKFFQWGEIYAVNTIEQGVIIRKIYPSDKANHIKAVSNSDKYKPFDIPLKEITGIAMINKVLRDF